MLSVYHLLRMIDTPGMQRMSCITEQGGLSKHLLVEWTVHKKCSSWPWLELLTTATRKVFAVVTDETAVGNLNTSKGSEMNERRHPARHSHRCTLQTSQLHICLHCDTPIEHTNRTSPAAIPKSYTWLWLQHINGDSQIRSA